MDAEPASSTSPVAAATETALRRPEMLGVIWSLAWPVILTLSIESLVGLVDMLMVGRLGANAVAAVGVGVQILSTVTTAMFAVGTGTLAVAARHIGAREHHVAEDVMMQSIIAAASLSFLFVVPVLLWAPAIVRAFGVAPAVVDPSAIYVRIEMLGVPADAMLFVVAMALRAAGDTRTPLMIGALVGIVKLATNYTMIFGNFGMPALGVAGAACGTALAFNTGALLEVVLLSRGVLALRLHLRRFRLHLPVMRRVLAVGYPSAIENMTMQFGFYLYIVFASQYGTAAVAAYFIGVRILALSFLPGFGFAAAAGALVGQNLGAHQPERAERGGWDSTRLALYMMTAAGIVIFLCARPIARLFVDDPIVIDDAVPFIWVLAAAQPLMAIDFTLGGALRGAGDTRFPLLAVLVGFYGCRLGFAYLAAFVFHLPVFWVWFALIGDYIARSLLKGWRFRSGRWKTVHV